MIVIQSTIEDGHYNIISYVSMTVFLVLFYVFLLEILTKSMSDFMLAGLELGSS